jgi:hypothetical protein
VSVVSKPYISVETIQEINRHPVHWPLQQRKILHHGYIPNPLSLETQLPSSSVPRCVSDSLLPISERKFEYMILYQVLFSVFVLRARTRVEDFLNFLLIRNQLLLNTHFV